MIFDSKQGRFRDRMHNVFSALNFLDCTIYFDSGNDQFEFKNYQKESKSNVLIKGYPMAFDCGEG